MRPVCRAGGLFLFSLALSSPSPGAVKPPTPPANPAAHYGVYLQNSRVGSMVTRTLPTTFEGKPATREEAETDIQITALGSSVGQKVSMSYVLDRTGRPLQTHMSMSSLGRSLTVDARYLPAKVVCSVDASGDKSTKVVPIPKGVTLVGDPELEAAGHGRAPQVGLKQSLYFFEPVSLTIQKLETEVVKSEQRSVGGKKVTAYLLKTKSPQTGNSTAWVDAKGELLEDSSAVGIRIVREDVDMPAAARSYEPPRDFAVATSVKTAVHLPEARKTRLLRLKISGLPDDGLVLSDSRQQVIAREQGAESVTATYLMQSRELPAAALPIAPAGATGPGLGDAVYLGTNDPAIRSQARQIAGGEKDREVIARRVRSWVKGHMEKPTNVGTPRSAVEIMRSRDGVCRDYATLCAALDRAAGVPARVCSGIVYFQDGFFYHAWVECQLTAGGDGWYAFDPTLEDDFVDATHVKFAQGDPVEMYNAVRAVGQIKAEILEFK